jgi:hypothetical protein
VFKLTVDEVLLRTAPKGVNVSLKERRRRRAKGKRQRNARKANR